MIIILFLVLFIWQREKTKKLKKKEEESKSNPISSVCLCTSGELKGKLSFTNTLQINTVIPIKGFFFIQFYLFLLISQSHIFYFSSFSCHVFISFLQFFNRIALESDFVFFVSLEIPCGRSSLTQGLFLGVFQTLHAYGVRFSESNNNFTKFAPFCFFYFCFNQLFLFFYLFFIFYLFGYLFFSPLLIDNHVWVGE